MGAYRVEVRSEKLLTKDGRERDTPWWIIEPDVQAVNPLAASRQVLDKLAMDLMVGEYATHPTGPLVVRVKPRLP